MSEKGTMRRSVRGLFSIRRYIIFFLLMAFVITWLHDLVSPYDDKIHRAEAYTGTYRTGGPGHFFECDGVELAVHRYGRYSAKVYGKTSGAKNCERGRTDYEGGLSVRIPSVSRVDIMSGFDVIANYFNQMAEELSGMETLPNRILSLMSPMN